MSALAIQEARAAVYHALDRSIGDPSARPPHVSLPTSVVERLCVLAELATGDEIERLRADAQDPRGRIGGVLSYRTSGHNRPCGQIVGAEGGGDFCFLLMGTPEQAHIKAREIVGELKSIGHRLTHVVFVECSPDAGYYGNPVSIIDAAQQEGSRDE